MQPAITVERKKFIMRNGKQFSEDFAEVSCMYVYCTASDLVCTSCTRGVQENGAIGLVILQTTEILGLIIRTYM